MLVGVLMGHVEVVEVVEHGGVANGTGQHEQDELVGWQRGSIRPRPAARSETRSEVVRISWSEGRRDRNP